MTINPQYTYDNNGNPLGVFLTLKDWNTIAEDLHIEPADWQKKLIDLRLQEYQSQSNQMIDADVLLAELDKEDMQ